jgi:polar amino acid transport system substrate-binding protein
MSKTDKRKELINFSDTYYSTTPLMIGAKSGNMDITPEHLAGKIIGVQAASIHANYADKYFAGTSTVKAYPTQDEANQDLVAGRIDYVLANGLALDSFLKSDVGACCESKGAVRPDASVFGEGVGLGLRKEDVDLQTRLNVGIKALAAAGVFAKITEQNGLTGQIILPAQ